MKNALIVLSILLVGVGVAWGSGEISSLTAMGGAPATDDLLECIDTSDTTYAASGTNKKMTITQLFTSPTLVTPALGTPASGTLTNCTGLPVAGITASTATALGVGSIELGHASDTSIARTSSGIANVEGANIITGTLGATANVIPKASGTGTVTTQASGITEDGTKVDTGALNFVTTGTIDGALLVTKATDNATTVTGSSGYFVAADDEPITFNLPAAPTGKAFCFANLLYGKIITVNPDDADYIVLDGVTAAAGEAIVSTAARNSQLCVVGIDADYWKVTAKTGTWAEATPP